MKPGGEVSGLVGIGEDGGWRLEGLMLSCS